MNLIKRNHTIIITIIIFSASVFAMWNQPPHIDVAWRLYEIKSLLAGKQMYVDFIGPNMPMITFVYIGSAVIETIFNVHEFVAYKIFTFVTIGIFLYPLYALIKKEFSQNTFLQSSIYVFLLLFILIWPIGEFGQKEHFALLFVLPYFLSRNATLSKKEQLFIGISAGVGFNVKPMFLLVPFLIELYRWIIVRKNIFTIDNVALGAITSIYYSVILLFFNEYINIFKIIMEVYDAYNITQNFNVTLLPFDLMILCIAILAYFIKKNRLKEYQTSIISLLIGSLVFFVIATAQMKGWINHYYPGTVLAGLAGLILLLPERKTVKNYVPKFLLFLLTLLAASYIIFALQFAYQKRLFYESTEYTAFISGLREFTYNKKVHVFTTSLLFGYPTSQRAGYIPTSSFNSYWMLPDIVNYEIENNGQLTPELANVKKYMIDKTIEDISAKQPDYIFTKNTNSEALKVQNFDYIRYFSQNPDFERLMEEYDVITMQSPYYTILKHK